ncbi:MAG TPA: class I SAM-dependent rRNA methyltransferase [Flavobacteriales bacterium]|nr:class I SAM-dependent rRNA methyltransferase [Flavobacteriales bacterium]HIN41059.1 class I SAM-dependent rRNA methyltransferase [Flavobacteriales bacterium]HIO16162.1 class I SAM-dependent rRNA methyltransferase [Flavobacteriales bacterium]
MNNANYCTITIKPKRQDSILRRHPWVFSGAIKNIDGKPGAGDWVCVRANKGALLGWGHYSPGTSIAVRMLTFGEDRPDEDWWKAKINEAIDVRHGLGLLDNENNDTCRLVFAEGDGLPGLIADFYGGVLVIQCHTPGMHNEIKLLCSAFSDALGDKLIAVYDKSSKSLAKHGGVVSEDGLVWGKMPKNHYATELGHKFNIDWEKGQKTGFFIDQRENRNLLAHYSKGKKVLNVFSYTGGFSIYAMKAGATEVHSLDSSARALEVCDENVLLNDLPVENHKCLQEDAVAFLKSDLSDYDIIILDPPAFAKRASARHNAVQGYKRINLRAIESMKPGSLLFTFSCSQAVDEKLFTNTIIAASIQANRTVRILHRLHQPADHPVSAFHPEGAYLKGLVLRVD